ncbi:classical arabinogalactan protein 26-like [Argentina anserina]|uniref:classical arabinogalactan protein 26-like n=1 Tax=Argentina anserina TaxID=57926 RepID=UPI00217638F3|nr:classical arabinogalactan protein 26-like [Potentilla anserina]
MASFRSFMAMLMFFMAYSSGSSLATKISSISAAPAVLPGAPAPQSSSPTLSPDISPLFPSPSGVPLSPSESSLPTIPSSPSPPNPEAVVAAPEPELGASPSGAPMPVSHSVSVTSSALPLHGFFLLGFLVFCVMQV